MVTGGFGFPAQHSCSLGALYGAKMALSGSGVPSSRCFREWSSYNAGSVRTVGSFCVPGVCMVSRNHRSLHGEASKTHTL